MTADFTRWSKGGKEAVIAAFSAFPVANLIAMLTGAVIVAAGGALNPPPTAATSCRSSSTTARSSRSSR